MTILFCVETGKKTKIKLNSNEPYMNDEIIDSAANRLLRREYDHKYDFVCIRQDSMKSEIYHAAGDLTEHTGEHRTFRLVK